MPSLRTFFADALHIFFPHNCAGCGSDIITAEHFLCIQCVSRLPHTGFEKITPNPIENIFRGRLSLQAASSQFYFSKGHLVQYLIHQLKYKGNRQAGEYLGAIMGRALKDSGCFTGIDYLVPLPLYADKEYKRGYNQSEIICNGMQAAMQVPVHPKNVIRKRYTETQTKKHRAERWQNVEESFAVLNPEELKGRHILLVDDVITTGATIEACGQAILDIPGTSLSVATLAAAAK